MLFTKWYPSEYWSLNNWAILWPRLRGKNEVQVKFENSMHNYNVILVHHTLGYQCSSFGSHAVHKMEPVKQPKSYWRTDGQTDGNRQSNSRVGLHATRLKIDTFGILQLQTITNFTCTVLVWFRWPPLEYIGLIVPEIDCIPIVYTNIWNLWVVHSLSVYYFPDI